MTERSSCKSFFKEYFIYRIKEQKMNFILCCILNVLALPLFAAVQEKGFDDKFSNFYLFGKYFSILCFAALIIMAIVGAVFSFEFYIKKNLTDTIGSLPLSYKQRFWADFLAGYIMNVAPVIPCGLISAVILSSTQNKFAEINFPEDFIGETLSLFQVGLYMAFSLFIAVTFAYLFSVFVVSGCGKFLHSVIFSIFGTAALSGTVIGITGCFVNSIIGVVTSEYISKASAFCPLFGSVMDLTRSILFLGDNFNYGADLIKDIFMAINPISIVVFVIFGAGITAGAFFLGKRRKSEKTGSSFVIKPMFYVISSLLSASAVMIMLVLTNDARAELGTKLLVAFFAGAVICLVSEVIYLPKLKELPKSILCCCAAIGVSLGIAMLFNKTGSFGLRYLPEDAENIEYLRVYMDFVITDKEDIKQYLKKHNDILKNCADYLTIGGIPIECQTTDGKMIKRYYGITGSNGDPFLDMLHYVESLNGYGKYFFARMDEMDEDEWDYLIVGENERYDIPEASEEEFIGILRGEAETKYDPNAEIYARVDFSRNSGWNWNSFNIQKDFEKTIAFLEKINGVIEKDPNEIMIEIGYRKYETNTDLRSLHVYIRNKDMDSELVKELIGLMENNGENGAAFDMDTNFLIVSYNISDSKYSVDVNNTKRVLEIMTELALGDFE